MPRDIDSEKVIRRQRSLDPFRRPSGDLARLLDLETRKLVVMGSAELTKNKEGIRFTNRPVGGHALMLLGRSKPRARLREQNTARLLDDFFSLVEVVEGRPRPKISAAEVRKLACRYGPLEWCGEHGAPFRWFRRMERAGGWVWKPPGALKTWKVANRPEPDEIGGRCQLGWPGSPCRPWHPEPIELWKAVALEAVAIRNLAGDLHANRPGETEDWGVVFRAQARGIRPEVAASEVGEDPKRAFAHVMEVRLSQADLCLGFRWRDDHFAVVEASRPPGSPLYAAIMYQLAILAMNWDGRARCVLCGERFELKRSSDLYCDLHTEREVNRHKKNRQYERERRKRERKTIR